MDYSLDKYLFHEGKNFRTYEFFGSFLDGNQCTFRVWAPHAQAVFVSGDFCGWEPTVHELTRINNEGIFEGTVSNVRPYDSYKYVIKASDGRVLWKADPYARHAQTRPESASKVYEDQNYLWKDETWLKQRSIPFQQPMNIYEVHLGSWKRGKNGEFLSYRQLADTLIPYVKQMHYTHIELLPITEFPYDPSWGYQVTGYFAVTSRFGTPDDFKYLIDKAHQNGIGIILDWVPGHFTKDEYGLYEFDGECCYEYSDERKKEHKSWGTRVFDYGRGEVCSFLFSSACYWIEQFHLDGLRVDAVSSMLFLDYDRPQHLAAKNIYGGNENLEVLDFFKTLNYYVQENYPGVMMIAEEATAYPKITAPIQDGGLGFHFKWNMGWMNDSLDYIEENPIYRQWSHNKLTFSMCYAFVESFILPISHDEVVHLKKSLLDKFPVGYDDKFSNYKTFLGYMFAHPGKKLTFMGTEIPQFIEWDENKELDWMLLDFPSHYNAHRFAQELNQYYRKTPALWQQDGGWEGFEWHVVDDASHNVFAFSRKAADGQEVLVISNFSGENWEQYSIGFHDERSYKMALNSDAKKFGGQGIINRNLKTKQQQCGEFPYTLQLTIPAFSTMYLEKK
ncbi:1,4-alpha-glucan branching protein GlgB [Granulicatella elegans]|uniref:1,4-alpha-glucan branching protein GlgB n=1 Tax=Granulicatella elegans TaxID=137732 RepID=UPI001D1459C4|nr:1,4-alpha-glucan branching protein GlgB [Granulicatella elegans]UEA30981.1 1,4-alpha-glucan branching protein GlgB [Granulicatella elegans]